MTLSFDGLFVAGTLLSLFLFLMIARHLRRERVSHRLFVMHHSLREQRVLRALPVYCLLVDVLVYTDSLVVSFTDHPMVVLSYLRVILQNSKGIVLFLILTKMPLLSRLIAQTFTPQNLDNSESSLGSSTFSVSQLLQTSDRLSRVEDYHLRQGRPLSQDSL